MNLRLIEIELNTSDPEKAKEFYQDHLGLNVIVDQKGLKVFDSGVQGVDLIKSDHFPGKLSISFFTEDMEDCIRTLTKCGVTIREKYGDPVAAIVFEDPDGIRVEIKKQRG